ncbi:hypothetical protein MB901379_04616 [Mycobacterium basiliense]|uniref:Uncharacterized protein n=1 Tax=Mycobacterium basiliense TaxID=2094119 RepID=A0A3S5D048_9MYCO|nr:hypothetical protein [Mycobacterium basiliense]VDM91004.1 hypothetical protein MB901379_04616 [Mycobacterium basiliense]
MTSNGRRGGRGDGRARSRVNWVLAVATVPGATIVMLFALGAVMSTASCGASGCSNLGVGIDFGFLFYGAPVVAVVAIAVSAFTAKRRGGIAVPLIGIALLVADVVLLAVAVAQ